MPSDDKAAAVSAEVPVNEPRPDTVLQLAAILERHAQKLELLLHPAGAGASAQEPHLRPWDFVLQCCAANGRYHGCPDVLEFNRRLIRSKIVEAEQSQHGVVCIRGASAGNTCSAVSRLSMLRCLVKTQRTLSSLGYVSTSGAGAISAHTIEKSIQIAGGFAMAPVATSPTLAQPL